MQYLEKDFIAKTNKIIGQVYTNRDGKKYIVKNYYLNSKKNSKKVLIEFLESGFKTYTNVTIAKNGKIIDRMSPTVAKVGFLGNATFKNNEKFYILWKGMLRRCYDKKDKSYYRYGGIGIKVCKEWHNFENFLKSIKKVKGYDEQLFNNGKLVLDKDFLQSKVSINEKIYSEKTCFFMSASENSKIKKSYSKGKKIKVKNILTGEEYVFNTIYSFSKTFKLNRHKVGKIVDTKEIYKNWIIEGVDK